jgi:hypothetical protein
MNPSCLGCVHSRIEPTNELGTGITVTCAKVPLNGKTRFMSADSVRWDASLTETCGSEARWFEARYRQVLPVV